MGDLPAIVVEPTEAAKAAGLRYVTDRRPGLRRLGSPKRFRYLDAEGHAVRDAETLQRIRSLVIPPAWTEVWICPLANGHLQATGRDARGRKQSRYHPRWREVRDANKYERMTLFAAALPRIRKRVTRDLKRRGLPREKVLATIVSLMEETHIRVGNEEYARTNKSYGLTTLRNRHVDVHGATITFDFAGKSGVHHTVDLRDARLARIVRQCEELPGQELFQYVDEDGEARGVDSSDVNAYLQEAAGGHFTAKDFRTWAGSVLAHVTLAEIGAFASATEAKRNVVAAIKRVAERLGNTPSVCRKCYVHPAVLEAYLAGAAAAAEVGGSGKRVAAGLRLLRAEEQNFLHLLSTRLKTEGCAKEKGGRRKTPAS